MLESGPSSALIQIQSMADTSTRRSHDRPPGLPERRAEAAQGPAESATNRQHGSGSFDPSYFSTPNTQYSCNVQGPAFSGSPHPGPQVFDAQGFAYGPTPYDPEQFASAPTPPSTFFAPTGFPAPSFVADMSGAQWYHPPPAPAYLAPAMAHHSPGPDRAMDRAVHAQVDHLQHQLVIMQAALREELQAQARVHREDLLLVLARIPQPQVDQPIPPVPQPPPKRGVDVTSQLSTDRVSWADQAEEDEEQAENEDQDDREDRGTRAKRPFNLRPISSSTAKALCASGGTLRLDNCVKFVWRFKNRVATHDPTQSFGRYSSSRPRPGPL